MKLQDRDNEIQKLQKDRELDKSEYQTLLEQYQQVSQIISLHLFHTQPSRM